MKRRFLTFRQAILLSLLLVGTGFYLAHVDAVTRSLRSWTPDTGILTQAHTFAAQEPQQPETNWTALSLEHIDPESLALYWDAITDPKSTTFDQLDCPTPKYERYNYLKVTPRKKGSKPQKKYFFALDLRQCLELLPQLLGAVIETIRFLGAESCAVSIVEGNSDDGTAEVLRYLGPRLKALDIEYHYNYNTLNPMEDGGDRIGSLAFLRNLALAPLTENPGTWSAPPQSSVSSMFSLGKGGGKKNDAEAAAAGGGGATVIFINDVAICVEDILELVHQRAAQSADMVCAMDWCHVAAEPTFYDVWVARQINGNTFFHIPDNGSWDDAEDLFWDDHTTLARYESHEPFAVFACWNGATVFRAQHLFEEGKEGTAAAGVPLRFRRPRENECFQGEPELFCKDLWHRGHGRIAVVPSVNVEYTMELARDIKSHKGFVSQWLANGQGDTQINWRGPPDQVRCMPSFDRQSWQSWDQGMMSKRV